MASIWTGEIDASLISLVKSTVNRNGVNAGVTVQKPEGINFEAEYPLVTFFNYDTRFDEDSHYPHSKRLDDVNTDTGDAKILMPKLPYHLYYQIDFWSKYRSELNKMTFNWISMIDRNYKLVLLDTEGIETITTMRLEKPSIELEDSDGTERLFRQNFSYKIKGYLDERTPEAVKLVLGREINVNE